MQNNFLSMAMANLANLAKNPPATRPPQPVFSQISRISHSQEGENFFHHTHQAGPHVTLEQLPHRLVAVATLYCLEVHRDTPDQVQEMLDDLTWNNPKDWPALIQHFEKQIPKIRPPRIATRARNDPTLGKPINPL